MSSVEKILIVDDDAVVRGFINDALTGSGYECLEASMAREVFALLAENRISLILLDIKLPDQDGLSLLPQIMEQDEDICAVMMTGVVDIRTAISAIRGGAFDYIIKPFTVDELYVVVSRALNKRRLEIENKNYQRSIEEKNLRLEILHDLSVKVAYYLLSTVELEDILRTILVGITAGMGLGFNRAFLVLFDDDGSVMRGKMAVGPGSPEEAGRIWSALQENKYTIAEALEKCGRACQPQDARVNQIVREIVVPGTDMDHIFIRAANERRAFHVAGRRVDGRPVRDDIVDLFGVDEFAVVPLCSPYRVQGIIVADNFITGKPIKEEDIAAIELFANQASMAIEKSRLYSELAAKLAMLEAANEELQESRDLLIRAERLSAIGEMAAQIAHEMRNPLASVGGLARFIQRHTKEDKHQKHLDSIVKETEKMEDILAQVFKFIQSPQLTLSRLNLNDIVSSSLSALSPSVEKFHIEVETAFAPDMPDSELDGNQMRQAVMNICKNSVDAMPTGGRLRVSTRVTPQNIEVEISDTGTGIDRDMLDKARQPFFTTKTYGVGLGLNIAEQIVRAHKGKMEISSGLGTGVRVNITLPRSAEDRS